MVNDTIADMLTRIRNANLAKHQLVQVPATKMTRNIVKVLQEEGFIDYFEEVRESLQAFLLISLKYQGKKRDCVITSLKRVSKPGLRVYASHKEIPKVLGGLGIAVISTSKGVMTDRKARHNGLGGEILCYIW
uniref:Small ribosomal subunit protein uS8c n=1 Tax=Helminthocladia australis TaxID=260093 RepID=A0A1G4NTK1_9FLOR|nr:Ribosomal protein S8 [Helminthocladia australis]SCW22012.1 Ribosomal protein S8 [Helminthocladia australis]